MIDDLFTMYMFNMNSWWQSNPYHYFIDRLGAQIEIPQNTQISVMATDDLVTCVARGPAIMGLIMNLSSTRKYFNSLHHANVLTCIYVSENKFNKAIEPK